MEEESNVYELLEKLRLEIQELRKENENLRSLVHRNEPQMRLG